MTPIQGTDNGSMRDEPSADLLGGVLVDAQELIVAHGEGMKLEVRDELRSLKGVMKLVGVVVGWVVVAGMLASQALVFGLTAAPGLPLWASYAIVAVLAGLAGHLVYRRRPDADEVDLVPERSLEGVKRDARRLADVVTRPGT